MITLIVLLWVVIKLQAPLWMQILVVFALLVNMLTLILKIIEKLMDKKLERELKADRNKLMEQMWERTTRDYGEESR